MLKLSPGIWESGRNALLDYRIGNLDEPSYLSQEWIATLNNHVK